MSIAHQMLMFQWKMEDEKSFVLNDASTLASLGSGVP